MAANLLRTVGTTGGSDAADVHQPRFTFRDEALRENAYLVRLAELQRPARERRREPGRLRELAATFEALARRSLAEDGITGLGIELLAEAASMWSLAGYQANAVVLSRELRRIIRDDPSVAARLARVVAALIGRDVRTLQEEAPAIRADLPRLADEVIDTTDDGEVDVTDAALLACTGLLGRAAEDALRYWSTGRREAAEAAVRGVEEAAEIASSHSLVDTWLLLDNLRVVLEDAFASSTWRKLRGRAPRWNSLWRRHLRLLAAADPPLVELWPSQQRALDAGFLSTEQPALAVRMPTSSGKSHLTEFAILGSLAGAPGEKLAAVVVPSRALASETERRLSDSLGRIGLRVSALFGGYDHSDYEASVAAETDVLVATAEKVDLLLRQDPALAERLVLLIIDEADLVDDEERGLNFELLVARIRWRAPAARTLMLSAVIPNLDDFGRWLDREGGGAFEEDWTPATLRLGVFYWHPDDVEGRTGRVEYVHSGELDDEFFLPYVLERRRARTRLHPLSPSDTAAALALYYARLGPVLVGAARRLDAEAVAKSLDAALRRAEHGEVAGDLAGRAQGREILAVELAECIGSEHPLVSFARKGFAYHHAGVPEDARVAIEAAYRRGDITILCATSTLSQGVNLPTRAVIVSHTNRGQNLRMTRREFRNLAGRAGRAFSETDGHVILVAMDRAKARRLRARYIEAAEEPVRSWLFRLYLALASLRINGTTSGAADVVFPQVTEATELDDTEIAERVADHPVFTRLDVQLLALMAEEVVDTNDEAAIEEVLGLTLCAAQIQPHGAPLRPLARYVRTRASRLRERVPDAEVRASYYRTGLPVATCEELLAAIDEFLAGGVDPDETSALERGLLERAAELSMFRTSWEERGIEPDAVPDLAHDWVQAVAVDELLVRHGGTLAVEDVATLSTCIESVVARDLPWVVSAALEFLRLRLGDEWDPGRELSALPARLKFGVPTSAACYAASIGIRHRATASALGAAFSQSPLEGFGGFTFWLSVVPTEELRALVGDERLNYVAERAAMASTSREALRILADGRGTLHAFLILEDPNAELPAPGTEVGLEVNDEDRASSVRVAEGDRVLGALDRAAARCLTPLLDAGASAEALVAAGIEEGSVLVSVAISPAADE